MDLANEELNLFFEDRGRGSGSSGPQEQDDSDDEDRRQELEDLLYSQVHYDDSVINKTAIEDKSLSPPNVGGKGPKEQPSNFRGVRLPRGCAPSQFNHPGRTQASRYYDVNQEQKNANPVFIAPQIPGRKRNPKSRSNQLTHRATRSWVPSDKSKSDHSLSERVMGVRERVMKGLENTTDALAHPSVPVQPESSVGNKTSQTDSSDKDQNGTAKVRSNPSQTISEARSVADQEKFPSKRKGDDISEDKLEKELSPSSPKKSRQSRQHSFEAKVSKVLSSLLDEESRSSLDESHSASICAPQQDVLWNVGLSWADMSSKSFGIDSIEEESVCSLQLQDVTPAESRTNTPDPQARCRAKEREVEEEEVEEEEEEVLEESRYNKQLKSKQEDSEKKEVGKSESDSESEVGSIVEVAPPEKPAPPVVDISDGEYVPLNERKKLKAKPGTNDIVVLFTKQRNNSGSSTMNCLIDSSSDDDVIVLDETTSSMSRTKQKEPSKKSTPAESSALLKTPQRCLSQVDVAYEDISSAEDQLLENISELLDTPISSFKHESQKLDQWLYDPIKSTRILDHGKLLRKMSSDPNLWQICHSDRVQARMSPRGPKCVNCNQFGHKARFCPDPRKVTVCHMCGDPGHSETRCPMKMCLRCGRKTNLYTDRCNSCLANVTPCKVCEFGDHEWKLCPDLWRRFHLTISNGEIVEPIGKDQRPRNEHWCSNCAGNGHLSHECRRVQWKCQSISPYIKSYASAADEESKVEQSIQVSMLLTKDSVPFLTSPKGKTFLDTLSQECNVPIIPEFDNNLQRLILEGVNVKLEEVRHRIRHWIDQQRSLAHKEHLKKEESVVADPWELPPNLPKARVQLADIVARQLNILKSPVLCDMTVGEIFDSLMNLSDSNESKKRKKLYTRMLNMILLGKCGFAGGHQHMDALRSHLANLRGNKVLKKGYYNAVSIHFRSIFGGRPEGINYEKLVKKFYSNKNLVKMYDYHRVGVTSGKLSTSEGTNSKFGTNHDCIEESNPLSNSEEPKEAYGEPEEESAEQVTPKKLAALETRVLRNRGIVTKYLSSRFICCSDQKLLNDIYKHYCSGKRKFKFQSRKKILLRLKDVMDRLCKSYNINIKS